MAKSRKTIIFGGAFNPPTLAHEKILEACIDWALKNDAEIWIVPSGNRTDKKISTCRSARIEYINAMIDGVDSKNISVKVHLRELDRGYYIETYDTYMELCETYKSREFIWVYGSDAAITMHTWKMGKWLIDNMHMILIKRSGIKMDPYNHATIIDINMPNISSTDVRNRLMDNRSIDDLVSDTVKRAIIKTPPGMSEVFTVN